MDHPAACMPNGNSQQYLGMLPTIKNSPMAATSTELGNIPFNNATHVSIIFSHLPVAWRNQYNLTHKTIPGSPRTSRMHVKKYNKKTKANKAKAATALSEFRAPCAQETDEWGKFR